jgi:nitroimidazol reductase NimA-like FMN-containing flavoprotein (pyridoxamine 5'-phosphate oxidase superfamily)
MKEDAEFRKHLGRLLQDQLLAALSTQQEGQPYASLVAFVAGDDIRHIYFVTPSTTRKYANLKAENRVALLINSSVNQVSDFHQAVSVTAVGRAAELEGREKEAARIRYLAKHPYLADFVKSPTCAFIDVTVATYYMVRNFQNVTTLHMPHI